MDKKLEKKAEQISKEILGEEYVESNIFIKNFQNQTRMW